MLFMTECHTDFFTHRKSEVDISSKTSSLGVFSKKNHLVLKSRNLDNEVVFSSAAAGLASLSTF